MTLVVVDSGVANLASVMAALQRLGVAAEITAAADKICKADRVILPGVGSAAAAMTQLRAKNLVDVLRGVTQPLLGICLGMQLLFEQSEENSGIECLGILPGKVKLLHETPDSPVPHMGWNQLDIQKPDHPLLRGITSGGYVYFVHSFAVPTSHLTLASTQYAENFSSIVGMRNFFGCQFHPERSSTVGAQILRNFLEM
jgi:glutamine amidotransferase